MTSLTGVGKGCCLAPLPPNRACGSPAHGSPQLLLRAAAAPDPAPPATMPPGHAPHRPPVRARDTPGARNRQRRGGAPTPAHHTGQASLSGSRRPLWTKWTKRTLWTVVFGLRGHAVHAVRLVHSSARFGAAGRGWLPWPRRLTPPAIFCRRFAARGPSCPPEARLSSPPSPCGRGPG